MRNPLHARVVGREELSAVFTNVNKVATERMELMRLANLDIPERGAIVGRWSDDRSDPLPDLLVVRDEDLKDTFAWLSSYFSGIAPITQWCRICTQSEVLEMTGVPAKPSLGNRLAAWVGAVLAECSAQANYNISLKELPGTAALTSATFAAARAIAIWGNKIDLTDLARRHEDLYTRLREGGRLIPAGALVGIWHAIENFASVSRLEAERRALEPLAQIIRGAAARQEVDSEALQEIAAKAARDFHLPGLLDCARGPQLDRLKALDLVANELGPGNRAGAVQGILGFAANSWIPERQCSPIC